MEQAIRYSEAFKLQLLRELEEGKFNNLSQAARAYGLSSGGMVRYWARKCGKTHPIGSVVHVKTPQEARELRQLRNRLRELEKELATAHKDNPPDGKHPPPPPRQSPQNSPMPHDRARVCIKMHSNFTEMNALFADELMMRRRSNCTILKSLCRTSGGYAGIARDGVHASLSGRAVCARPRSRAAYASRGTEGHG